MSAKKITAQAQYLSRFVDTVATLQDNIRSVLPLKQKTANFFCVKLTVSVMSITEGHHTRPLRVLRLPSIV